MIREIRPDEVDALAEILFNAYPGSETSTPPDRARIAARVRGVQTGRGGNRFYGAFRDERLVGGMRLFDFRMNLHGSMVDAGGVGVVAVDLLHKKEHVAKELMTGFLDHYRGRGTSVVLLYAFRTDFYHRMGFGHGPQVYRYKLPPGRFPMAGSKRHIVRLEGTDADKALLKDHYHRLVRRTHGLIERTDGEVDALFAAERRLVWGYREGTALHGYMLCSFEPEQVGNMLSNNLHVTEFFYDSPDVLAEFLTFLGSQADQLQYVVLDTPDAALYHLLPDARDDSGLTVHSVYQGTSASATGIMYRVVDTRRLFEDLAAHDFGGQTLSVRFVLDDTFLPANAEPFTVRFDQGRPTWLGGDRPADVEVRMGIAAFSSLAMGAVPLRKLASYGLASVSDDALGGVVDRLFDAPAPPVCVTAF